MLQLIGLSSCQSPPEPLNEVLLIGFVEEPTKGENVGLITGDDCSYTFFDSMSAGSGKLRKAFDSARSGTRSSVKGTLEKDVMGKGSGPKSTRIRYFNNVTTETEYSNYVVFSKYCLTVSGKGFQ
ncbi:MAG: hypothetical protein NT027_14170 [Proteobacteria bacterium]|nr:hypothetical protein [Pseudomonadota bacterium]